MQNLENSIPSHQEVIYEVGYSRMSGRTIASILGCTGASYLYTQSPITAIWIGILSTMIFAQGAVGHASLLTPSKKIESYSALSCPGENRSKVFGDIPNDFSKNPRIQIRIKATDSQIETIESSRIVLSTTCSHGSSRLLAKAGLPHASFPISLSPTLTAFYLDKQKNKNDNVQVKYLNWKQDQPKIEIRIATVVESILLGISASFVALLGIPLIYASIYK